MALASEPTWGSVKANAPSISPRARGRKEPLLLLLIAVAGQDAGDEIVHRDDGRCRAVAGGDLLACHGERAVTHACAAPLLADGDPVESHRGEPFQRLAREFLVAIPARRIGGNLLGGIAAYRLPDFVKRA